MKHVFQICYMSFRVDHNTRDFIELINGDLKDGAGVDYFGPTQLIEYTVGKFSLIKSEDGEILLLRISPLKIWK